MKALLLCGGLGTRLRPLTFTTSKHLLPVANKPMLYFGIENLVAAGIREIGIIVSQESSLPIAAAVGDGSRWGSRVTYIEQPSPAGLANACACAESFIAGADFVMYLGDNLIPAGLGDAIDRFRRSDAAAVVMLKAVENPRGFGIAQVEGDRIVRLVEKPKQPLSNLAIVGGYIFCPEIFESIRRIAPSARNELEITDAIQNLIDRGLTVLPDILAGYWRDMGTPDDLLAANRVMLDKLVASNLGELDASTRVEGVAVIAAGARISNSRIVGPVIVGADATISDAQVGPHVAIGDRARIVASSVTDAILMEDCSLERVSRPIAHCLLGRQVKVVGCGGAEPLTTILGDGCELWLP